MLSLENKMRLQNISDKKSENIWTHLNMLCVTLKIWKEPLDLQWTMDMDKPCTFIVLIFVLFMCVDYPMSFLLLLVVHPWTSQFWIWLRARLGAETWTRACKFKWIPFSQWFFVLLRSWSINSLGFLVFESPGSRSKLTLINQPQ